MRFSKEALQQGRMNQRAAEETPGSFGSINGSDNVNATADLTKSPRRMAGVMGARAMDLLNNPEEIQRTKNWMQQFGMSNEGMQFNQAKMMRSQPQQEQPQPEQ